MKVKTSELTGAALDWAVAKCEATASPTGMSGAEILLYRSKATNAMLYKPHAIPYATDWAQGGPIIEREKISVGYQRYTSPDSEVWDAVCKPTDTKTFLEYGPTPLIAAMRCYVASKFGEEVEIPDELMV